MNEVETFARIGERAGAAVGSGVRTARKRARTARDAAQAALADRAEQAQEVLTERWDPAREALTEGWRVAQDVFTERMDEARRELAARIEPEPRRRRRWPWLVLLVIAVTGAAGAAVLARRPRQTDSDELTAPPAREPGSSNNAVNPGQDPHRGYGGPADEDTDSAPRPSAGLD